MQQPDHAAAYSQFAREATESIKSAVGVSLVYFFTQLDSALFSFSIVHYCFLFWVVYKAYHAFYVIVNPLPLSHFDEHLH